MNKTVLDQKLLFYSIPIIADNSPADDVRRSRVELRNRSPNECKVFGLQAASLQESQLAENH